MAARQRGGERIGKEKEGAKPEVEERNRGESLLFKEFMSMVSVFERQ
jgi:hypothetical protein